MNLISAQAGFAVSGAVALMAKTIVFGLLKSHGKIYTEIVPDCSKAMLQAVVCGHIESNAVIHSDGWRGYDGLVDIGCDKHLRVNHSANEFANGERHINGIENFWSYVKRRLTKFNGVPTKTFLHLKETEFRFNHRRDNLYLTILKLFLNPLYSNFLRTKLFPDRF